MNLAIRDKLELFNQRLFQKKEGSRRSLFLEEEKPLLAPLPATRFELSDWKTATVQFNYHISVDGMLYSVPYEYIKKKVDFSGTASELIEKLKSVSDETFYSNRVTRDLVQNGYTLRKYGIDFQYKRTRNGRLIILHYDRERDSSDSKNNSEVTVDKLIQKV